VATTTIEQGGLALATREAVAEARRQRLRERLAHTDYLRLVKWLTQVMTQREVAAGLGVSQPAVAGLVKSAEKVPDKREGFSGADAREIAERYAAGLLTREDTIGQLGRWEYQAPVEDDWLNTPGTWVDVEYVADIGLIDAEMYEAIAEMNEHLYG
jgi:hypothetical protein